MPPSIVALAEPAEMLIGAAFSAQEFAHACGVTRDWVLARVEAGVLCVDTDTGEWRFDSVTLVRARRIAQLERTYGADPQLAALTTDLIEEVARLRQRLGVQGELRVRGAPMPAAPSTGSEPVQPSSDRTQGSARRVSR